MRRFSLSLSSGDMAIDLGTANTVVYIRHEGIVLREPSVVARRTDDGRIIAVGAEAKQMTGRAPDEIAVTRPMRGGVIADFDTTSAMLGYFMRRSARRLALFRPRVIVGIPSGVTEVEKRAVIDAAGLAGAREVFLVEEPLAAAIGARLPVFEPTGSVVVDIGGGVTEVAVISLGSIVVSTSMRVGGDEMDDTIVQYCRHAHGLLIGERTAEETKMALGSAYPLERELTAEVRGQDLISGLPRVVRMTSAEVREALSEPVARILEAVRQTLERTPPELAADIVERGIVLAGGGALLRGIDRRLQDDTGLVISAADDPLSTVVLGAGRILEDMPTFRRVLTISRTR